MVGHDLEGLFQPLILSFHPSISRQDGEFSPVSAWTLAACSWEMRGRFHRLR